MRSASSSRRGSREALYFVFSLFSLLLHRICITPAFKLSSSLLCGCQGLTAVANCSLPFGTAALMLVSVNVPQLRPFWEIRTKACDSNKWCCCWNIWMLSRERDDTHSHSFGISQATAKLRHALDTQQQRCSRRTKPALQQHPRFKLRPL